MTAYTRNEKHPVQTSYPWILKQSSEEQIETVSVKISQAAETEKEKESILCKTCKNEITTAEYHCR